MFPQNCRSGQRINCRRDRVVGRIIKHPFSKASAKCSMQTRAIANFVSEMNYCGIKKLEPGKLEKSSEQEH